MKIDLLASRLEESDYILIHSKKSGQLRVLEKSGRIACDIAAECALDEDDVQSQIGALVSKALDSGQEPHVRLVIQLVHQATERDGICKAVSNLCNMLGPEFQPIIQLHFDSDVENWGNIKKMIKKLRESSARPNETHIELLAPLATYPQEQAEALFELGLRLRFVSGWTRSCPSNPPLAIQIKAMRQFSEIGFRIPVEWYVHAGNMADFEEQIPELLANNYCSGFSLPLVSENPYYQFKMDSPEMPEAMEYCQFLVRNYRLYPFYDDVFSPLNILALRIRDGGWNSKLGLPAELRTLIDEQGVIGLHHQCGALARQWATAADVAATPLDVLERQFRQFASNAWQWEKNPFCAGCSWRHVCGGIDAMDGESSKKDLATRCAHRKLFLEHFSELRAPAQVFGAPQTKS